MGLRDDSDANARCAWFLLVITNRCGTGAYYSLMSAIYPSAGDHPSPTMYLDGKSLWPAVRQLFRRNSAGWTRKAQVGETGKVLLLEWAAELACLWRTVQPFKPDDGVCFPPSVMGIGYSGDGFWDHSSSIRRLAFLVAFQAFYR